ncbi:MAG: L-seryl-tRNA selenium transferase, partial [Halalkalicoccus sp.]|nr:L-seryl-tRNA selenium transferase [Halalkalicoccus sp.]
EELAGLLAALDAFIEEDDDTVLGEWHERAERIAAALESVDTLTVELANGAKTDAVTSVVVTVDEDEAPLSASELVLALRQENPRMFVGADDVHQAQFMINPRCLPDAEVEYVVDRITANLER